MTTRGARGAERPGEAVPPDEDGGALAKNSLAVVAWTGVSRASGFLRIAVTAAVLGPTYLGNIFQATNNLPMIVYAALTGSLFSSLLVPPMVKHIDAGDPKGAERLARAFLSTALAAFAVVAVVIVLAGPLLLRLLSVGVPDPAAAADQRRVGFVLLIMFIPQLFMYAVMGTAEAVANAHGRFALAAGAPTLENVGTIATLIATAVIFGTGDKLASPTNAQLFLLGIGTTSGVALHAAVQWWGARRVGVTLLPSRGWREPEIKAIIRRGIPSLGYSTLDVIQPLGAMMVANRVAGGVIAFQFAMNFYSLPSALGARPVAVALLPRLSRLFHADDLPRFRGELVKGASLVAFLTVPAAVAFVVLAMPIVQAVTFGQMASERGQTLVAMSLAALGPGVLGYAALLLGTYACYARQDARTPFTAIVLCTVVAVGGMTAAFLVPATAISLFTLGVTISAAQLVGGWWIWLRLGRLLPSLHRGVGRPLLRTLGAAVLMSGPAYLVARLLGEILPAWRSEQITLVCTAITALIVYLLVQRLWRSPELAMLGDGLRALRPRGKRGVHTVPAQRRPETSTTGDPAHRSAP